MSVINCVIKCTTDSISCALCCWSIVSSKLCNENPSSATIYPVIFVCILSVSVSVSVSVCIHIFPLDTQSCLALTEIETLKEECTYACLCYI